MQVVWISWEEIGGGGVFVMRARAREGFLKRDRDRWRRDDRYAS